MPTPQQRAAQAANIRKLRSIWRRMTSRPESRAPGDPASRYYHVEVSEAREFDRFRLHDVGAQGGIQRVAGKRRGGTWDTQKWLISKELAHVEQGHLVPDHAEAGQVLESLGASPRHRGGDAFSATPPRHGSGSPAA